MTLEKTLDKLHAAVTANKWLQIFTAFGRVLLAVGFIPPSIKKITGQPFTVLPDSTPVGHYFNALYQTGFYYEFLGWGQLAAAVLLLIPRTAHLGALAFFPIILNIAVLTGSVGFAGTNYITALMLIAATYLVAWDYDRLKAILFAKRTEKSHFFRLEFVWLPVVFAIGGLALASVFAFFRVGNLQQRFLPVALTAAVAGFVFGLICAAHHRFMKTGELQKELS
ncbi:MAG TPA: hypothetical protein VF599_06685 [Pyrinomonadaceae bacterium]|jgi:hypothetical protein